MGLPGLAPHGRRRSVGARGALGGWLVWASLTGSVQAGAAPALAPASAPAASSSCQAATTTLEMQECLARQLRRAERDLERYLDRAQRRLSAERDRRTGASAAAASELAASQQDWRRFRDRYCQAVWSAWSGGTIRGPKLLECRLSLARERQRRLWADFLSFPDGTPPLLPEPPSSPSDSRP